MATVSIGQRFSQLIKHLGISKNAFAQSLNKTATVVQHLVDERNKPGYDLLCKVFEVYPAVSKDWLLLGQGPMLVAGGNGAASAPAPGSDPETIPTPVAPANPAAETPAAEAAPSAPGVPSPAAPDAATPTPPAAANATLPPAPTEAYLTAALHAQHLQHQLALAEQRNQHLLAQQQLMQQMLDLAQRR